MKAIDEMPAHGVATDDLCECGTGLIEGLDPYGRWRSMCRATGWWFVETSASRSSAMLSTSGAAEVPP